MTSKTAKPSRSRNYDNKVDSIAEHRFVNKQFAFQMLIGLLREMCSRGIDPDSALERVRTEVDRCFRTNGSKKLGNEALHEIRGLLLGEIQAQGFRGAKNHMDSREGSLKLL